MPFHPVGRRGWLYDEHPDLFEKAVSLEERTKHFPARRLTKISFRDRLDFTLRVVGEPFRTVTRLPVLQAPRRPPAAQSA